MPAAKRYRIHKPIKRSVPERRTVAGRVFDSIAEAEFYRALRVRERVGEIDLILFQVPIPLPGGAVYKVDFVVFYTAGVVRFYDVKGRRGGAAVVTEVAALKKRLAEALHPLEVEIV